MVQEFVKRNLVSESPVWERGTLSFILATKALYKLSMANEDFKTIVLSDSTVPLKSFDYVYTYLTRDDKSYFAYQGAEPQHAREQRTWSDAYQKFL